MSLFPQRFSSRMTRKNIENSQLAHSQRAPRHRGAIACYRYGVSVWRGQASYRVSVSTIRPDVEGIKSCFSPPTPELSTEAALATSIHRRTRIMLAQCCSSHTSSVHCSHRLHSMRTTPQRSRLCLLLSSVCLLLPALATTSEVLAASAVAHPTTPALYTHEGPGSDNRPALPTLWSGILDLSKPCQQGE